MKVTPVLDWDDEESMQIIFASAEEENFSCVAIRFEMPETADAKITWRDAQL